MSLSQAEHSEVGFGQSIGISRSIGVTLKPKCVPFAGLNFDRWKVEFPRAAAVPIRWPFFWHDAPWHRVDVENASRAASQATDAGIFVAGLSCEVGTSVLHQQGICPYRPDRYGLCVDDIAHRSVIDLRLVPPLNSGLPPRYLPEQLKRWGILPEKINPHAVVDASHWPADVRSVDGLAGKVRQLRALARDASAIWITVDAAVAVDLLPALVQAAPDAVIVRLESGPISLLREALSALRKPLDAKLVDWRIGAIAAVVEPLDAVLLWSWGAELIAVDRLLNDHLQAPPAPPAAAENSFFGVQVRTPSPMPQIRIGPIVTDWLERTASLVGHLGCASPFDLYLSKMVVAG